MADKSFSRAVAARRNPEELRLPPPPRLPERLVRAFPELRAWEDEFSEWSRKTTEQIRIALDENRTQ